MGRLYEDMTRIYDEIGGLHTVRETALNDLRREVSELKATVQETMEGFQSARSDMAQETRAGLESYLTGLKGSVTELKRDTALMQANFREAYAEMTQGARADRKAFVSGIRKTVSGFLGDIRTDLRGMSKIWAGLVPTGLGAKLEQIKAVPAKAERESKEETEELTPDDLTRIKGIGPLRQNILNEAGFYTFARLAKATPERLRPLFGDTLRLNDLNNWIAQARLLA